MSTTTEALELIKLLEPKIGEEAASRLIDYTEKQKGDYAASADISISMLKWAVGILSVAVFTLSGLVWQLNTKIHRMDKEINQKLDKILLYKE